MLVPLLLILVSGACGLMDIGAAISEEDSDVIAVWLVWIDDALDAIFISLACVMINCF